MPSHNAFKESKSRGRVALRNFKTRGLANNPFVLRPWQKKALPKSKKRNLLVEVPTGAGKSKFLIFAATKELLADENLKVVIAIPKLAIAKGFNKCFLQLGAKTREWFVGHNFCGNMTEKKIYELTKFLGNKEHLSSPYDRIAICSHMALVEAYQRSGADAFQNTIVVIDEMHHVLCSEEISGTSEETNQLGEMVSDLVRREDSSIRVWGLTATYFRGDRQSILPDDVYEKFTHHFVPLDEHWEEGINFIESFSFDFVIYKKIFDEVKRVLKKSKHSIVFCPGDGHTVPNGLTKTEFLNRVIKICKQLKLKYLDLVTEAGRRQKYKTFFDEKEMKSYDVVLAVRAIDEGADWVDARNVLDLVPSSSLTLRIQRFGRLLRDIPGKKHIKYHYFLPFGMLDIEDKRRDNCNELFASWAAGVTIHQLIKPIKIPKDKKEGESGNGSDWVDYFNQQVPNASKREQITQKVLEELVILKAQNGDKRLVKQKVQERIVEVLKKCGVKKNRDKVAMQIASGLRRAVNPGIDISKLVKAGFDKVWHNEVFDGFLKYGTAKCGKKTFSDIRDAYNSLSLAETHPELAKEWHPTKNGDLTPHDVTLGSQKKVWWVGKCEHGWEARVANRTLGQKCPFCCGLSVDKTNSLATLNPELSQEWHPTKNGKLTPHNVTLGSQKKVWWIGKCGHEWEARIAKRVRGSGRGCPFCRGLSVDKTNSLAALNPELSQEWHPTKNGKLTPHNVTVGSNKRVWWIGKCGHEWKTMINYRTRCNRKSAGCPYCYGPYKNKINAPLKD